MVFFFIDGTCKLNRFRRSFNPERFRGQVETSFGVRGHVRALKAATCRRTPKTRWTLAETTVQFRTMWRLFAAFLLSITPALAQGSATAYEALSVVSTQLGRGALNHIVSVTGVGGDPQPEKWKIILEDPDARGGARELQVADERIASDRPSGRRAAGSTEGATIDMARLNLDSSGAYAVASHTAEKSHTQFVTVSYTLRTDERGEPVWIVTLLSKSSRPVGTIYIGATRGTVRRTEGMFAGATMEDVENDYDRENKGGVISSAKTRIKEGFQRTQEEARGMFERVKRSFSDFISRE
jgi:hypothetical protein